MPTQLRNEYAKNSAIIERRYLKCLPSIDRADIASKAMDYYYLNVRTLFNGMKSYLEDEKANKSDYENFFRELIFKGAPAEVLVCAATLFGGQKLNVQLTSVSTTPLESKDNLPTSHLALVKEWCNEWGTSIDAALHFAVIEYATNMSQLGQESWLLIINRLLASGANPCFETSDFVSILSNYNSNQWVISANEVRSAFLALFTYNKFWDTKQILLARFMEQQKDLVFSSSQITESVVANSFPLVPKSSTNVPFYLNPWFLFLEKNFLQHTKTFLVKNADKIFTELANIKDYASIDSFRIRYGMDPFPALIKIQLESMKNPWFADLYAYLDERFSKRVAEALLPHQAMLFDRFSREIKDWAAIMQLSKKLNMDPVPSLMASIIEEYQCKCSSYSGTHFYCYNIFDQHIFKRIEQQFPAEMKAYIYANKKTSINRIINSHNTAIAHLANHYDVELYSIWNRLEENTRSLVQNYYLPRCQLTLEYIFKQQYPCALSRYRANNGLFSTPEEKQVTYNNRTMIVSKSLSAIIEALNNSDAASGYGNAKDMAIKLKKDKPLDIIEQEIYNGLASLLTDTSSLSQYFKMEKEKIGPKIFLLGTHVRSSDSDIYQCAQYSHYDKNVWRDVFDFLGNHITPKKAKPTQNTEEKSDDAESRLTI